MKETRQNTSENLNLTLGNILREILIPACIVVDTEVDADSEYHVPVFEVDDGFQFKENVALKPSDISIMLKSLEKDDWTYGQKQLLPDGIRDFHARVTLMEFKYDEPAVGFNIDERIADRVAFCKAYGYDRLDVLACLVTNHDFPESLLKDIEFCQEPEGVYKSDHLSLEQIRVIALNDLRDTPWNASLKYFSKHPEERESAILNLKAMGLDFDKI